MRIGRLRPQVGTARDVIADADTGQRVGGDQFLRVVRVFAANVDRVGAGRAGRARQIRQARGDAAWQVLVGDRGGQHDHERARNDNPSVAPSVHHREHDQTNRQAEDRAAARGQREADDEYGHTHQQPPQMRDGDQQQNGARDQLAGRVLLELPRETVRIEHGPGDREHRRGDHVGPQHEHVIAPKRDERADEQREDEQLEPLEALHRRPEPGMQREENDDQPSVLDEREAHGPQGAEHGKSS